MDATSGEPKLFTPGPLTTSRTVKEAMLIDLGSREVEFTDVIAKFRRQLLDLAGVTKEAGFEAVPVQGSGTYGIEAMISSAVPAGGKLLVLVNGVYGDRMVAIAAIHGISTATVKTSDRTVPTPREVEEALAADPAITHVAVVHCETTTGILNPVTEIGRVVKNAGKTYLIDAMSSFGGIPLTFDESRADFIVSSSNKCIEGVPGFSFVLARRASLDACAGQARTMTLDLHAQWAALEKSGQFRFTPPTHVMLAFSRALDELIAEGGVAARNLRYAKNQARVAEGMRALGFHTVIKEEWQSPIITTFLDPTHPNYDFEALHDALKKRGCAIYPGKLSQGDAFRIGSVGQLFPEDIEHLLTSMEESLVELGIEMEP